MSIKPEQLYKLPFEFEHLTQGYRYDEGKREVFKGEFECYPGRLTSDDLRALQSGRIHIADIPRKIIQRVWINGEELEGDFMELPVSAIFAMMKAALDTLLASYRTVTESLTNERRTRQS